MMDLSFESDRLVALMGMVLRLQRSTDLEVLLWDPLTSLTWVLSSVDYAVAYSPQKFWKASTSGSLGFVQVRYSRQILVGVHILTLL
jgi:hypothetical protein